MLSRDIQGGDPKVGDITELLSASRDGDVAARDELFRRVHSELVSIARARLAQAPALTELDACGLVNEAYVRLAGRTGLPGADRRAFYAYAARLMRSVIVDRLRERRALKRGGDLIRVTVSTENAQDPVDQEQFERLDAALTELSRIDERGARIVEMRFFAGLSIEDVAATLELSPATVKRDWMKSRAFLFRALRR